MIEISGPSSTDPGEQRRLQHSPASPRAADVCLVTLTCGGRPDLLEQVLSSVAEQGVTRAIVVHNGAGEEHLAGMARRSFAGDLELACTGRNRGSAGGYRFALGLAGERAKREYLWLLDDDNRPADGALSALLDTYRLLSPAVPADRLALLPLRESREYLLRVARGMDPRQVFPRQSSFLGFHWRDGRRKLRKLLGTAPSSGEGPPVEAPVQIPFGPYGGLFFHRSVVSRIGYPDERFFLYGDDIEYTHRLAAGGGKIFLVPGSRVADLDPSWREEAGGNAFSRLLLAGSDSRVFYSVRNQVFFERRFWTASRLEYLANKAASFLIILLLAMRHGRLRRAALLFRAARSGERGLLGRAEGFPGQ